MTSAPPAAPAPAAADAGSAGSDLIDLSAPATGGDDLLKVFSASQQEEPLYEAPVPVTVITAEMIRSIGARNLQDVLTTFVPGITLAADQNELNVAMRGVYASSQQKILVLLDGHRLNSHAYSSANPDFGIALDELQQVEVLRGPASSLYGNVALTAVVNLVTKTGRQADGLTIRAGAGNYGQRKASLVYGHDFENGNANVLVWGSFYRATGELRTIPASEDFAAVPRDGFALLGAVRDPASYDVGAKLQVGPWSFLVDKSFSKVVEPFTSGGVTGETYDYARFRTFQTIGPGLGSDALHLEAQYHTTIQSKFDLQATAYYDSDAVDGLNTTNPETVLANFISWNDNAMGGLLQGRYDYELAPWARGNLTLGTQIEQMHVLDSVLPTEVGGDFVKFSDSATNQLLARGSETIYSGFLQLKQRFGEKVILNVGARYDNKDRFKGENVSNVSPRLSFIWMASENFGLKASYAQSFVDAPYWYRYNSLPSYRGAETLTPEHLESFQFTPDVTLFKGKVKNGFNFFYNHLYDFVFRNNNAAANEPIYQNAGLLRTLGFEDELSITGLAYRIRANATYQYVVEGKDYGTRDSRIYNVPPFVGNVVVDAAPLYAAYSKLWTTFTLRYYSQQLSPLDITFRNATGVVNSYSEPNHTVPDYVLVNAGVRVDDVFFDGLSAEATVYNVFDQRYSQGGSTVHPYPQPGRWFLVNLVLHAPE